MTGKVPSGTSKRLQASLQRLAQPLLTSFLTTQNWRGGWIRGNRSV